MQSGNSTYLPYYYFATTPFSERVVLSPHSTVVRVRLAVRYVPDKEIGPRREDGEDKIYCSEFPFITKADLNSWNSGIKVDCPFKEIHHLSSS